MLASRTLDLHDENETLRYDKLPMPANELPDHKSEESDLEDHRAGLDPPRFSLSMLMGFVAILCVLLATLNYAGLYAALGLLFLLLTIAAHVAGNALGTQLRDNTDKARHSRPKHHRKDVTTADFAPPSQLHNRSALGLPILVATALGSVAAAAIGGYGLTTLMEQPTIYTIFVGGLASAVLGGIWTFAASSFLQVASGAVRQAADDSEKQR